ncbi:hypothetical protein H9X85_10835 [Anaerotignum lactatifermentans]|uniref:Uncharacterized protein n=1 Tax=Anaerotignum lactatifermentans TaxID=160404 RepID=A0ABS2GAU2_9FIRM|nr:hypothetical protein [Anaerotignum lactatifermentans]MBM6830002.1 hypothetical protein [Anaerotignum lactatifermentans]MBM6878594.1 hypothetical protein [Anaerotignum lactatifermentans]MBM6951693.1 hypothetical protein [Anaerotignum lactatifermentans]
MKNFDKELSRNGSGYSDPTAATALRTIYKKEKEIDRNAMRLIGLIKDMLRICDFELIEKVKIRHKPSGREYK